MRYIMILPIGLTLMVMMPGIGTVQVRHSPFIVDFK